MIYPKISCNDDGATFIEARITGYMSLVLQQQPGIDELEQLFPCRTDVLLTSTVAGSQSVFQFPIELLMRCHEWQSSLNDGVQFPMAWMIVLME